MKIFMLFGIACWLSNNLKAIIPFTDTTKPYRITQQQFLDRYGKDDTTTAIVNYYFKKRKNARKDIIVTGAITAVSGSLLLLFAGSNAIILPFLAEGLFAGAIWMLAFTLVACLYRWLHFSRKNLLKTLNNYFSGNGIPRWLKKHIYKKRTGLK